MEIQIAVQIDHELIRHVKSVDESLLCHDRLNTGVGVQRQILSIREIARPGITVVHTCCVHDRKMHGDRSGLGLQSIAGISQLLEQTGQFVELLLPDAVIGLIGAIGFQRSITRFAQRVQAVPCIAGQGYPG